MSIWSIYEDDWNGYDTEDSDYDESYDYFSKATGVATNFMKSHPEADKNIVYDAAANAAAYYSEHTEEMKITVSAFIRMKINTALKIHKTDRKSGETKMKDTKSERFKNPIPDYIKHNVIEDKMQRGLSNAVLAKMYNMSESSVSRILLKAKSTTATDATDAEDIDFCILPEHLKDFAESKFGMIKILSTCGSDIYREAEIRFQDKHGNILRILVKKLDDTE